MGRNNKAGNYDISLYQTPIYKAWSNMHSRCGNEKVKHYNSYGGRGIKVCSQWDTFEGFLKDMQSTYVPGHQLDRIDNDGNYEPLNCRWSNRKTQCRNRRSSRFITHNGLTKTVAEWAELSGVKPSLFRQRLYVKKLPIEQCLSGYKYKQNYA